MIFRRIVIAVPEWDDNGTCRYAADLARELVELGLDARILVTEPAMAAGRASDRRTPEGVVVETLPRAPHDRQSDLWLALVRYLEENAPSVYVSNRDWTAALVCPRLSSRVQVIGVLHDDSQEEYDHCARLGEFWNAIVVRDPVLRQRIIGEYPKHAARLASFPPPDRTSSALARHFSSLIESAADRIQSGEFRRSRGKMQKPPLTLVHGMSNRELGREVSRVNAVPLWPDRPVPQALTKRTSPGSSDLRSHRIVLAVPTGRVSGVDVFSINFARELIKRGYQAELVQTAPDAPVSDRLPLPDDVPVFQLETKQFPTWRERWAAMRDHLEKRSPCIYVPNYDNRHSCIVPTLSPGVKVVAIGHSDDSQHYAHILHLAPYWDAVVGVSGAITNTIASLAPGLEERLHTIPYGVPVEPDLPAGRERPDGIIRALYAGRVVRFQKRALDLLSIADELRQRNSPVELTVAGSGTELGEFLSAGSASFLSRHLRYVGGLTNEDVIGLMRASDIFVLPSSFEGLPVSLLEAMANGCVPVVTAIRSGVPEVIRDGENGFLVPIAGIPEFADRISLLAGDRDRLERMKRAAYETVRDSFGIDKMTSAYIEVFERVIGMPYLRPTSDVMPPPGLKGIEALMPRFPMPLRRVVWRLRGKGS